MRSPAISAFASFFRRAVATVTVASATVAVVGLGGAMGLTVIRVGRVVGVADTLSNVVVVDRPFAIVVVGDWPFFVVTFALTPVRIVVGVTVLGTTVVGDGLLGRVVVGVLTGRVVVGARVVVTVAARDATGHAQRVAVSVIARSRDNDWPLFVVMKLASQL